MLSLTIASAVVLIGIAIILAIPNSYRSSATVYVDTESVLRPLLQGLAVQTDVMNEVNMMTQALMSRARLARVVRTTDLGLAVADESDMARAIKRLRSEVEIERDSTNQKQKANVFTISYSNARPEVARDVVKALIDMLVEETLGNSKDDTISAQNFLLRQIEEHERRLSEAEKRLAEFKRKNVGLMPNEGKDYYGQLQGLMRESREVKVAIELAKQRRNQLINQLYEGARENGGILTSGIDEKIEEKQSELDSKLLLYTDRHPDVIALRQVIEQLKEQRKKRVELISKDRLTIEQVKGGPLYEELVVAIRKSEVEIETLKTREGQLSEEMARLRNMVDTIPKVEARLADLNRSYNVTKRQYEALVQRLESAKLSQGANENSSPVKFRLIEAPVAAVAATSPNRMGLMLLLPLLASGIGVGVGMVLHHVQPTFNDRYLLRKTTGLPVLGSVSLVEREDTRDKRWKESFSIWIIMLVLTALLTASIHWRDELAFQMNSLFSLISGIS